MNYNSNNNSSHNNIRQSSSYGNLADESDMDFLYRTTDRKNGNIIKRTKSFWKFGKSDDILEGMSLWKHRDLVLTENEKNEEKTRESTLKRQKNTEVNSISTNSSETLKNVQTNHSSVSDIVTATVNSSKQSREHRDREVQPEMRHSGTADTKYHFTKSDIDQRISMQKEENVYGVQKSRSQQNLSGGNRGKMMRQHYVEAEPEPAEIRRQARSDKHKTGRSESKIPYSSKNAHSKSKKNAVASNNNNNNHQVSNSNHKSGNHGNHNNNNSNNMSDYYDTRENLDSLTQSYDDSSLIMNSNSVRVRDTNFYDDESVDDMLMKTVKRQEILKQYYSSGTDTERNSSSSDPYDCIVVDDHLARRGGGGGGGGVGDLDNKYSKNAKMDFKTFRSDDKDSGMESSSRTATLLPRTKLTKSSSGGQSGGGGQQQSTKHASEKQVQQRRTGGGGGGGVAGASGERGNGDNDNNKRSSHNMESKSYGPWYDLWGGETHGNVQKQ